MDTGVKAKISKGVSPVLNFKPGHIGGPHPSFKPHIPRHSAHRGGAGLPPPCFPTFISTSRPLMHQDMNRERKGTYFEHILEAQRPCQARVLAGAVVHFLFNSYNNRVKWVS